MCILLKLIPIYVWIKLNITQATEKIEIHRSNKKKKTNQQEPQELYGKPSNVEEKTTRRIRSIHYNKIEITIFKLYPKLEFTINWENTIIPLGINTTLPQNPIVRSSTLNTSTHCSCST